MPEQQSARGPAITPAPFEAPFETILLPFGPTRWNLQDDLIALPQGHFPRLTNVDNDQTGELHPRAGQLRLATGGVVHHSVRSLRDPATSSSTRIWGIDHELYRGASGALVPIDAGYSGDPLTLVPHRPQLSGAPWMFVADRSRMRKVRADGLDLPIGLPAPTVAVTLTAEPENRTPICAFDATVDGTNAATWTGTAGQYFGIDPPHAMGTPNAFDSTAFGTTNAVNFQCVTTPPVLAGATGYDSWWGRPLVRNLALVGGVPASDQDLIHLGIQFAYPHFTDECRVYLVCANVFDPTVLPGTSPNVNEDFYVKSFSKNDFADFIQRISSQFEASERARLHALRDASILTGQTAVPRDPNNQSAARLIAADTSPGTAWHQTGIVGVPLRRSEFQRVGNTPGRDWATIVGIVIYVKAGFTAPSVGPVTNIVVSLADLYLRGGAGPDSTEVGAQPYDVRYTHYDPRTGAEGNPSPTMAEAAFTDALRQALRYTPTAYGDPAVRQRFYRRGGSLTTDWFFAGENTSDGGAFVDTETDDGIAAAGSVNIDHYQPVPTVDAAGTTVLAQPLRSLWGPIEGMLFGCGDPYRPGHLYYCLPDQADHWSATGNKEVCAPSEELLQGGVYGSHGYVFSRRTLYLVYPGLSENGSVSVTPTPVKRGPIGYWASVAGPSGIFFVADDGIFATDGGPEEWISREIDPLFKGKTKHGYLPIDKAATATKRCLTTWQSKLYFQYQDTSGAVQCAVFDLLQRTWRHYHFAQAHAVLQGEDEDLLLLGGLNQGASYQHTGLADDGFTIDCVVRSGALANNRREEKLFGDQALLGDRQGVSLILQNFFNEEAVTNVAQLIDEGSGRQSYILDSFGVIPQRARSISTEIRWSSASARPTLVQLGTAITVQPEITADRVTNWDDLGHPDEKWVTGVTFDVDTFNAVRTILIERDFAGQRTTIATLQVQTDGRHKVTFSWAAVPAQMVRVRPSDECKFWVLYRADWIALPEPPRISQWDIHFENAWDQYYTGLDLYCDTQGQEKRIEVLVDNQVISNPFTGLAYFPIVANGRRVVHLTFAAGRGHVFRFHAIDDNAGLLYTHRWHLQEEPSEQANWNQNFSILGSRADKWLKAILFECDTFDATKQVRVEVDGQAVEILNVRANGRRVVQIALTQQRLGRVWRMYPADGNPGRLYSAQPVFDEEPFCLDRWETQETNHGLPGWFYLTTGYVTLKSNRDVVLTITMLTNQERGTLDVRQYKIPQTDGQKVRRYVSVAAIKGTLVKYALTSEQPFWLYQEETNLQVMPWGGAPQTVQPFGNADADPTRRMVRSELAAATPGGGT